MLGSKNTLLASVFAYFFLPAYKVKLAYFYTFSRIHLNLQVTSSSSISKAGGKLIGQIPPGFIKMVNANKHNIIQLYIQEQCCNANIRLD